MLCFGHAYRSIVFQELCSYLSLTQEIWEPKGLPIIQWKCNPQIKQYFFLFWLLWLPGRTALASALIVGQATPLSFADCIFEYISFFTTRNAIICSHLCKVMPRKGYLSPNRHQMVEIKERETVKTKRNGIRTSLTGILIAVRIKEPTSRLLFYHQFGHQSTSIIDWAGKKTAAFPVLLFTSLIH